MNIINIKGMSCGHCQKEVKNILEEIEGVEQVEVSLGNHTASFVISDNLTIEDVVKKINQTHYDASL